MTVEILPADFDNLLAEAIKTFWRSKGKASTNQEGARGSVIGGKNLDGFLAVVRAVADHIGLDAHCVHTKGKKFLTLPGFFRPIKNWDVVIVDQCRLLAAIEFKSQVGSFGNNFNNRCEEAIGNAVDLRSAYEKGVLHPERHKRAGLNVDLPDPRNPFLGYLMVLEDCSASISSVKADSPHFFLDPEFDGSSYADRYRALCERLMSRRLYDSAALALTTRAEGFESGDHRALSDATNMTSLFKRLAAHLLSAE